MAFFTKRGTPWVGPVPIGTLLQHKTGIGTFEETAKYRYRLTSVYFEHGQQFINVVSAIDSDGGVIIQGFQHNKLGNGCDFFVDLPSIKRWG